MFLSMAIIETSVEFEEGYVKIRMGNTLKDLNKEKKGVVAFNPHFKTDDLINHTPNIIKFTKGLFKDTEKNKDFAIVKLVLDDGDE